jgi:transcriptional regulator with XRE-family HTH domain
MRLRAARRAAKLSRRGLARAVKMSKQGVANLELGADPRLSTLRRLARALGTDLNALGGLGGPAAAKRGKK